MSADVFISFTPEELRKKSEELAGRLVELDELDEEKKEANKEFQDRRKTLSREIRRLTGCIRNKGEYQDTQASMFTLKREPKDRKGDA